MADSSCANAEYQLDVDEMVLEYLVFNTLKAHIDECDPEHRERSEQDPPMLSKSRSAPTLLSILDTHIRLFKTNHPQQDFSANTTFYLKLLEFLLLFTHQRGGPSALPEATYQQARNAGQENTIRRLRCWKRYEKSSHVTADERDLLQGRRFVGTGLSVERDREARDQTKFPGIRLDDLMPRFMELSAQMSQELNSTVSEMWLDLASEFMVQVAIEIGFTSDGHKIDYEALLACFGWGLPFDPEMIPLAVESGDADAVAAEQRIHNMLVATRGGDVAQTAWHKCRTDVVRQIMRHIHVDEDEEGTTSRTSEALRRGFTSLRATHPTETFETQLVEYIRGLQQTCSQLKGEPILMQIEQGRLDGLNEDEFTAFMARVGTDDETRLEQINIPGTSKI